MNPSIHYLYLFAVVMLKYVRIVTVVNCGASSKEFFLLLTDLFYSAGTCLIFQCQFTPSVIGRVFHVLRYPVVDTLTSDGSLFPLRLFTLTLSSSLREVSSFLQRQCLRIHLSIEDNHSHVLNLYLSMLLYIFDINGDLLHNLIFSYSFPVSCACCCCCCFCLNILKNLQKTKHWNVPQRFFFSFFFNVNVLCTMLSLNMLKTLS